MKDMKIGFIGTGNMGGALVRAAAKTLAPQQLLLANRTPEKAQALAAEVGGATVADNTTVAADCDFIFLGVKPQVMGDMLAGIAPALRARHNAPVLVSMAAGLSIADIRRLCGGELPVIHIMPNTPCAVGAGTILYCCDGVTAEKTALFCKIMSAAGTLDELPESLIEAGSALCGCGPAFVYMFIESLADGGVACGLPRAKAQRYAALTVAGAAQMAAASSAHPGALKDAVCSPGGSTIEGVRELERRGFRGAVMDAVGAAFEKNNALGK